MVFIDGDHAYDAVRQDWEDWSPYVTENGIVALHDSVLLADGSNAHIGPVRLVEELRRNGSDTYKRLLQVDRLTVLQKTQPHTFLHR
jgi:hypothetical protein